MSVGEARDLVEEMLGLRTLWKDRISKLPCRCSEDALSLPFRAPVISAADPGRFALLIVAGSGGECWAGIGGTSGTEVVGGDRRLPDAEDLRVKTLIASDARLLAPLARGFRSFEKNDVDLEGEALEVDLGDSSVVVCRSVGELGDVGSVAEAGWFGGTSRQGAAGAMISAGEAERSYASSIPSKAQASQRRSLERGKEARALWNAPDIDSLNVGESSGPSSVELDVGSGPSVELSTDRGELASVSISLLDGLPWATADSTARKDADVGSVGEIVDFRSWENARLRGKRRTS